MRGVGDGEATEETLGVLLVPFAFRISIAIISVGASSASELADTRDGINSTVRAASAVEDVGALSVTRLLGGVPETVLRFTTGSVRSDGRTASTAGLRGTRPFTAAVSGPCGLFPLLCATESVL